MKKTLIYLFIITLYTGLLLIQSCKKINSVDNLLPTPSGYSKSIDEIGLQFSFNFMRTNPDNFSIKLSDNYSLEQKSSIYNVDQKIEYFTFRCKKTDCTSYFVSGTVDLANTITISFQKTASITY